MASAQHHLIERFVAGLNASDLADELFTDDMTVWATTSGVSSKATYQGGIRQLRKLFQGGLRYRLDSLIAEGDCAAAEVSSEGTLINGEPFAMKYGYFFTLRDGRIATVAEHINPVTVQQKLSPLFAQLAQGQVQQ